MFCSGLNCLDGHVEPTVAETKMSRAPGLVGPRQPTSGRLLRASENLGGTQSTVRVSLDAASTSQCLAVALTGDMNSRTPALSLPKYMRIILASV